MIENAGTIAHEIHLLRHAFEGFARQQVDQLQQKLDLILKATTELSAKLDFDVDAAVKARQDADDAVINEATAKIKKLTRRITDQS